ncbi:MAG: PTPA-CTERM sorting domain-containing protein [Leptolyngbyaceae cyanobacterium]
MSSLKKFCVMASTVAVGAVAIAEPATAASITAFTSQSAWEAALSGNVFSSETFDGDASSFAANSTGNRVGNGLSVDLDGGRRDPGPTGLTGNGFFRGEVDSFGRDSLALEFNTAVPINGFGILGLRDFSKVGLDLAEIGIEVGGERFLVSDLLGLSNSDNGRFVFNKPSRKPVPFLGFVSTHGALDGFRLIHGDEVAPGGVLGQSEEFFIDGLVFAGSEEVPTPALLPGLIGMGAAAFSKRKKAAEQA